MGCGNPVKRLMAGNEAIARGAWEAGCRVGTAYPGTPSTEILQFLSEYPEVNTEWSPNEKVALEVAAGAAMAGARALAAMKHVGLNVAADPLFTLSYTGIRGGLVVITADDPEMHSSQNEQDNRHYARHAKVPMLEPSDSQEAKDMVGTALELGEKYQVPFLVRMTTRVCHSKSVVECGERTAREIPPYTKDDVRRVILPARAKVRRARLEEALGRLEEEAVGSPWNFVVKGEGKIGVVTSGIAYQYAREVLPGADFLKLGFSYPLPKKLIRAFAKNYNSVYVVEENDPILEDEIRNLELGIPVIGKAIIPGIDELSQERVAEGFKKAGLAVAREYTSPVELGQLPPRPPVLCPGCPHRGVYAMLRMLKLTATGDIGCYTLGALPPHNAMDTCVCMGAAVTIAFGLELAQGKEFSKKMVATIGESTFLHSGITGLIDLVYNKGITTVCILDNRITAMTGHQQNPATGLTLRMEPTWEADFGELVRACGVKWVRTVDPLDLEAVKGALKEATAAQEPAVIIFKSPCALLPEAKKLERAEYFVNEDNCTKCRSCIRLGCPGIAPTGTDGKSRFDDSLCVGCGLCEQVCKFDAVTRVSDDPGRKGSWCADKI